MLPELHIHPAQVQTRLASRADAAILANFNMQFNQVVEPAENFERRMAASNRADQPVIAEVAGHPAGFACLRLVSCVFYPEPEAELTEMYVAPAYRRQGVGRALLAAVEQMAQAAGASLLVLRTNPNNQPALALYRSQGYILDDMTMAKKIAPQQMENS